MIATRTYCVADVDGLPCCGLAGHRGEHVPIKGRDWAEVPQAPYSEVADRLFIGGRLADPREFDVVVSLHYSLPPAPSPVNERRWHIKDAELPDLNDLAATVGFVFYHWQLQMSRVLVRCQGGLNRSGLVVANTLIVNVMEPVDAIAAVRQARSPYALCNPRFEAHLLSLGSLDDVF